MESQTYMKNIKISPRKLRFLLPSVKKYTPLKALDYLLYSPKRGAKIYYKIIKSAIANAQNTLKSTDDLLKFKVLTVEEGQKLKRHNPGGRGTAKPYVKRFSHIRIVLTVDKPKLTVVKEQKKSVEPKIQKTVIKTVKKPNKTKLPKTKKNTNLNK